MQDNFPGSANCFDHKKDLSDKTTFLRTFLEPF